MVQSKKRYVILLHFILMIYSMSGIFSKKVAGEEFLSVKFCIYYSIILMLLAFYAIAWQQIIKHLSLTTAFANKAVTILWGLVWGKLFFNESITIGKIAGILLIIVGIIVYTHAEKEDIHE